MTRQRGFSLIELMLALALGVIVTAGIVQLFVTNDQTYTLLTGQARMQESARYALDFIGQAARDAGYYGCDPDQDKIYGTLNGTPATPDTPETWDNVFEFNLRRPLQAFDARNNGNGLNDWTPSLDSLARNTSACASIHTLTPGAPTGVRGVAPASSTQEGAIRPMTDVLVVRHVEIPGLRIAQIISPAANPVVEDPDGELSNANDGDFFVISNCEQAALFRATDVQPATPGAGLATLVRGTAAGVFDNAAGQSLSAQGSPYGEANNAQGASVGRLITEIYYIGRGKGGATPTKNSRNQDVWSLWRKVSEEPPVELVEGIEDLQVLFGIDTTLANDIDAANRYVDFSAIGNNAIRALRVTIVASSVEAVDATAAPLRRTFSQTISYRNG
jgi:type IV pilus assembly protein PilW